PSTSPLDTRIAPANSPGCRLSHRLRPNTNAANAATTIRSTPRTMSSAINMACLPSCPGAHVPGQLTSSRNSPPGEYAHLCSQHGRPAIQSWPKVLTSVPAAIPSSAAMQVNGPTLREIQPSAIRVDAILPGGSPAATAGQEPSQPTGPCDQRPVTWAWPADRSALEPRKAHSRHRSTTPTPARPAATASALPRP